MADEQSRLIPGREELFHAEYLIRNYEADQNGNLSPQVLLNFLQDIAASHARNLGVGVRDLHRHGFTWVLSRMHMRIHALPRSRTRIAIDTWPSHWSGIFSCREFEVFAETGECLACATSSWAVIDRVTRRPVRLNEQLLPYRQNPRRALADDFATLPRPTRFDREQRFSVRRSDLDLNGHVNNVVYAGWLLDTVPDEICQRYRLAAIELGFRSEAFAREEVLAGHEQQEMDGNLTFVHQVRALEEGRELVRARTCWVPLPERMG